MSLLHIIIIIDIDNNAHTISFRMIFFVCPGDDNDYNEPKKKTNVQRFYFHACVCVKNSSKVLWWRGYMHVSNINVNFIN